MQRGITRAASGTYPAALHHHHPVGGQCQGQVVQHGSDGDLLVHQSVDAAEHRPLVRGVEVGGRLVEQHHRRLHREHAREQHPLALAAGEFAQPARGEGGCAGGFQCEVDGAMVVRAGCAEQALVRQPAEADDIAYGEVAVGFSLLREPGDAAGTLARRERIQPVATGHDLSLVRRAQSGEHRQQRALACAVRTDDRGPLACVQGERHIVQHALATERHADAAGLEQRCGRAGHACLRRSSTSR